MIWKPIISVTITIGSLFCALYLLFVAVIWAGVLGGPDPAACFNAPKSEIVEAAEYFLKDRFDDRRSVRLGEFSNAEIMNGYDASVEIEVIDRRDNQLMGYIVRYNNCDLEWRKPDGDRIG
jgi:hypothetical protein